MEELDDKDIRRIRRQQALCSHPSFMCPLCHLYHDHTRTQEYFIHRKLVIHITYLEKLLTDNNIKYDECNIQISEVQEMQNSTCESEQYSQGLLL